MKLEIVNRALSRIQRDSLIEVKDKGATLLDLDALHSIQAGAVAQACPASLVGAMSARRIILRACLMMVCGWFAVGLRLA
ncbi:hypothetical protein [Cupriavidus sp. PET2-C1]